MSDPFGERDSTSRSPPLELPNANVTPVKCSLTRSFSNSILSSVGIDKSFRLLNKLLHLVGRLRALGRFWACVLVVRVRFDCRDMSSGRTFIIRTTFSIALPKTFKTSVAN